MAHRLARVKEEEEEVQYGYHFSGTVLFSVGTAAATTLKKKRSSLQEEQIMTTLFARLMTDN